MSSNLVVEVFGGDVEGALKRFKKRTLATGLMREIRSRKAFHVKPGEARRIKSLRARKAARKRAGQYGVRLDWRGDPL
jgi:ribosomal protein S21